MYAIVLILIVDPSPDVAASALTAATIDGLAGRAEVVVEHVRSLPADDQASARAAQAKADVIVEVSWPDAEGRRAHLHVQLRRATPWIDRELSFATTAPHWERGRAVGLAIAAMVPDDELARPTAPPATPTSAAPSAATAPSKKPTASRDVAARSPEPAPVVAPELAPSGVQLGALLELAPWSNGNGFGVGGRLEATRWLTPRIGLRATLGARHEPYAQATASVTSVEGGGGIALRIWAFPDGSSVIARADALADYLSVARDRRDGTTERHGRFVPATALVAEGSFAAAPRTFFVGAVGTELALGTTSLTIGPNGAGTLPSARWLVQLGVRLTF